MPDHNTPKRYHRCTPAEIGEILSTYDHSGVSQARFAREHGLAVSTLRVWLRGRRQKGDGGGLPRLIPVTVTGPMGSTEVRIEIVLTNGRRLVVPIGLDADQVGTLARALDPR
jgi:transposase-like protein